MSGNSSLHSSSSCEHGDSVSLDCSIGDLFRAYGDQYIKGYRPNPDQINFIYHVKKCKTPLLGGKLLRCTACSHQQYIYYSCGHSQCPLCQSIKRAQWQDRLRSKLLSVPYVHVVFTMPHELNRLARKYPKEMYNILMRVSWQTIKEVCKNPEHVGGLPGMISVLHTFGSDMKYHLHTHSLVTFGGLSRNQWCWPKHKNKLGPYREMSSVYRKLFIRSLDRSIEKDLIEIPDWSDLKDELLKKRWNVRSSRPAVDLTILENYLSRYINRIAISRSRLTYLSEQSEVQLLYNDYRNQESGKVAPKQIKNLHPLDAIHQIVQHVLPKHYQKSRYYGLHSSTTFKRVCNQLPKQVQNNGHTIRTLIQILRELLQIEPYVCKACGSEEYELEEIEPLEDWGGMVIKKKSRPPPIQLNQNQRIEPSFSEFANITNFQLQLKFSQSMPK